MRRGARHGTWRGTWRAAGLAPLLAAAAPAAAADVTVIVEDVATAKGEVHADLCDQRTFLSPHCPFHARTPAERGRVTLVIRDVPPGRYAAVAYHDANANRDLDLNVLGLPTERYGFSNDPPMLLGPPLFKDSAFEVTDKPVEIRIRLKR